MSRSERLLAAAPAFAALGDPVRLALVVTLGEAGPQSLVRLAAGTSISRQAVSRHLGVLEAAGLVTATKQGRETIWALEAQHLASAAAALRTATDDWR